jgi:hypothetical protein
VILDFIKFFEARIIELSLFKRYATSVRVWRSNCCKWKLIFRSAYLCFLFQGGKKARSFPFAFLPSVFCNMHIRIRKTASQTYRIITKKLSHEKADFTKEVLSIRLFNFLRPGKFLWRWSWTFGNITVFLDVWPCCGVLYILHEFRRNFLYQSWGHTSRYSITSRKCNITFYINVWGGGWL